jgi:hypothetical protein
MTVLDNSDTVGNNGKSIQYRKLTDFLGNRPTFNIIKCQCPTNEDEDVFRSNVVKIAQLLEKCDYATLQQYELIKWNCECFAWTCSTHGLKTDSDEAVKFSSAFSDDLSRGQESILLQGIASGSHSSALNCVTM